MSCPLLFLRQTPALLPSYPFDGRPSQCSPCFFIFTYIHSPISLLLLCPPPDTQITKYHRRMPQSLELWKTIVCHLCYLLDSSIMTHEDLLLVFSEALLGDDINLKTASERSRLRRKVSGAGALMRRRISRYCKETNPLLRLQHR